MYRFAICAIFVALCLASFPVLAEDTAGTHVCVGVLASAGGRSGTVARDTLIKFLNKQKKPPLTPVPLQPLDLNMVVRCFELPLNKNEVTCIPLSYMQNIAPWMQALASIGF